MWKVPKHDECHMFTYVYELMMVGVSRVSGGIYGLSRSRVNTANGTFMLCQTSHMGFWIS